MQTQLVFFLLFSIVFVSCLPEAVYQTQFTQWMQKHNKIYSHAEFSSRYQIFKKNYDFVSNHDSSIGFSVSLNQFADLTSQEFAKIYNGFKLNKNIEFTTEKSPVPDVPSSWDWRQHGAVTGIKNQGQCGSCWSFSSTGSTEAAHFFSTGNLVSLSEQNLVDCSTAEGNDGCNGGDMDQSFVYIIRNNGIDTEASYPYTATGPNQCRFSRANVGATLKSYNDVPSGDENALLSTVYTGPTSVAIDASHSSFQFYNGGVYYEPACSSSQLDHGVLAIGFGNYGGQDYWLVKNSWGTDWGMAGYIMMSRNRNNNCGIATAASIPHA